MTLSFGKTTAQQTNLDALLACQSDPASAEFHKWLTPDQYGEHFGRAKVHTEKIADG